MIVPMIRANWTGLSLLWGLWPTTYPLKTCMYFPVLLHLLSSTKLHKYCCFRIRVACACCILSILSCEIVLIEVFFLLQWDIITVYNKRGTELG